LSSSHDLTGKEGNEREGSPYFGEESGSEDLKDSAKFNLAIRSQEQATAGTFRSDHAVSSFEPSWWPETEEYDPYGALEELSPDNIYKLQADLDTISQARSEDWPSPKIH
jgi:hypothetical protein